MPLITDPYDFTNGAVADADQVDERFTRLYNLVNGGLDADNLATSVENSFLKLLTSADRKVAWGTGSISFNGTHAGVNVTHGMATTPIFALAITKVGGTVADFEGYSLGVGAITSTLLQVASKEPSGAIVNGTLHFYWLAIA